MKKYELTGVGPVINSLGEVTEFVEGSVIIDEDELLTRVAHAMRRHEYLGRAVANMRRILGLPEEEQT